jgi:hypothetical protein
VVDANQMVSLLELFEYGRLAVLGYPDTGVRYPEIDDLSGLV